MDNVMSRPLLALLLSGYILFTSSYPYSYKREFSPSKLKLGQRLVELTDEEHSARNYDDSELGAKELSAALKSKLVHRQQRMPTETTEFLEKFGYLQKLKDGTHQHDAASRIQAIKNFQRMYHMKPTGILDSKTMEALSMPRCGMPDMTAPPAASSNGVATPEAFTVPGYKWNKKQLTWKLENYLSSNELSQSTQKQAIRKAFQLWRDVSQLEFTETTGKSDINMAFASGTHSDGPQNAFDGPNGVLAHAFYPDSGELHYDSSEYWTDGKDAGINLGIVTAHELGHALGLAHSRVEGALMAPYYQGYKPNYKLPQDDIDGIQSLYGKRSDLNGTPAKTTVAPVQPNEQPDTCTVAFKATTQTHDNRVYVYNGKWMWRMSEYGLDSGFPALISSSYENPPDSVDAAIFTKTYYYTYFFRGNKLWTYYGFQLVNEKTISTAGYPVNPQAAIVAGDGNVYLLKAGNCWKFDEDSMDIARGNPHACSSIFPGAPATFDSALKLVNEPSFIYFFQGNKYYKYSETSRQILPGYPKAKAGPWMGPACGARPYTPR